jgi:hypothetical protein
MSFARNAFGRQLVIAGRTRRPTGRFNSRTPHRSACATGSGRDAAGYRRRLLARMVRLTPTLAFAAERPGRWTDVSR